MREGVRHLKDMPDPEFDELCRHLYTTGADFTPSNSKVNLKIDGCSLRIGICEGEFFIESSRSGVQTVPGAFSEYTKAKKGKSDPISLSYDTVLWSLKRHDRLQNLLSCYSGMKMFCELLFTPLAEKTDGRYRPDGKNVHRFLVTEYEEEMLGRLMTLVFYKAEDMAGYPASDETEIFDRLKALSDSQVRIYDQRITFDRFRVTDLVRRALSSDPPRHALKREMTERILRSPFTHPLKGGDFEGLVFYTGRHVFKVISDSYAQGKKGRDENFHKEHAEMISYE